MMGLKSIVDGNGQSITATIVLVKKLDTEMLVVAMATTYASAVIVAIEENKVASMAATTADTIAAFAFAIVRGGIAASTVEVAIGNYCYLVASIAG